MPEGAGKHYDLRIGNPSIGLLSWAVKKDMFASPTPIFRQPVHFFSYKDFEGRIRKGYGKGRVKKLKEEQVLLTRNQNGKLSFTTNDIVPKRFSIVLLDKGDLFVHNQPLTHLPSLKPKFRNIKDLSEIPQEAILCFSYY